jgi:hypothetical protein
MEQVEREASAADGQYERALHWNSQFRSPPKPRQASAILGEFMVSSTSTHFMTVNQRWNGTPYRHPKGTPLIGGFYW